MKYIRWLGLALTFGASTPGMLVLAPVVMLLLERCNDASALNVEAHIAADQEINVYCRNAQRPLHNTQDH